MVKKAVFFDRDGVINELIKRDDGKRTAPWSVDEFRFLPNIQKAVRLIRDEGFLTFVVTNQPDVNDGFLPEKDLDMMNRMIKKWLGVNGILCAMNRQSDYYKPNNLMVEELIIEYGIDRESSYMIGDSWKDIVCGHKSGLITIFIGKKYKTPDEYAHIQPYISFSNVYEACKSIKECG